MFRLQRKQRHDLPEKAQLSKYYEMDGALRAYANRMAVLGLLCGSVGRHRPGSVCLRPAAAASRDPCRPGGRGDGRRRRHGAAQPRACPSGTGAGDSGNGTGSTPSDIEGRAMARRFLSTYLTYTPANVERQYADALNMMTANLRSSHHEQISRGRHARENQNRLHHVEHQDSLDRTRSERAVDVPDFRRRKKFTGSRAQRIEQTEKMVCRYQVRLVFSGRTQLQPTGLLSGSSGKTRLVGERDIDLDQRSTLLDAVKPHGDRSHSQLETTRSETRADALRGVHVDVSR